MRYTWREEKRLRNLRDHYIDLADVEPFFDSPYIERVDDRLDYDEDRWVAIGLLRGHEIVVVYTEEGTTRHLISAREATNDERQAYWKARAGS